MATEFLEMLRSKLTIYHLEAMDTLNVDFATRETIYEVVRLAGQAAFDEDSKR